jgi:hypothetical protein
MPATELTKRKPNGKAPPPVEPSPQLSLDEMQSLREFVFYSLGDGHLTAWEENFLNSLKHQLYHQAVWLTDKQQAIIRQIKDKLHYDCPHIPLAPIDPDGIEENDDPDGWPAARHQADHFDEEEITDWA